MWFSTGTATEKGQLAGVTRDVGMNRKGIPSKETTWSLHDPVKMGSVPKIQGHDLIFKGFWRLQETASCMVFILAIAFLLPCLSCTKSIPGVPPSQKTPLELANAERSCGSGRHCCTLCGLPGRPVLVLQSDASFLDLPLIPFFCSLPRKQGTNCKNQPIDRGGRNFRYV